MQLRKDALAKAADIDLVALFGFADSAQSKSNSDPPDQPQCKAYPGTPEWPSETAWKAFDQLLGGTLIKTIPLAAPCFRSWPSVQDNATCAQIKSKWGNFRFQ